MLLRLGGFSLLKFPSFAFLCRLVGFLPGRLGSFLLFRLVGFAFLRLGGLVALCTPGRRDDFVLRGVGVGGLGSFLVLFLPGGVGCGSVMLDLSGRFSGPVARGLGGFMVSCPSSSGLGGFVVLRPPGRIDSSVLGWLGSFAFLRLGGLVGASPFPTGWSARRLVGLRLSVRL